MKQVTFTRVTTYFLVLTISALLLYSFIKPQQIKYPGVGEVRYSMLEPGIFREQNGTEWVLLDGRKIDGSNLSKLGVKTIPDARGIFIRGMNEGRSTDAGDAEGDRAVGAYQADEIKTHIHDYSDAYFSLQNCGNENLIGLKAEWDTDNGRCALDRKTASTGGKESRPRNITLYVYIKIN